MTFKRIWNASYGFLILGGVIGLCAWGTYHWDKKSNPPMTPAQKVSEAEKDFQDDADEDYAIETEGRQATMDFAKNNLPGWTVKGLSSVDQGAHVFKLAIDLEKASHVTQLSVTARKFFPESGDPYWRVTADDPSIIKQLETK